MGLSKLWGKDSSGARGFVFSHVKSIYYNWSQKKLLSTKLDEIDESISSLNSRLNFTHGVQSSISVPGNGTKRIEISIEGISSNSVIIELIVNGSTYVFVAAVYKSNNVLTIDLRNFNTADANIALEYTVMI